MSKSNEVILLVEDDRAVRDLIRQVLLIDGYRVIEAANGQEAAELSEKCQGPIHLLVSDVVMPNIGGFELANLVRARHIRLKVLFLSGHSIDYVHEQVGQQFECAFLQKPFAVVDLAHKVREALDQLPEKEKRVQL